MDDDTYGMMEAASKRTMYTQAQSKDKNEIFNFTAWSQILLMLMWVDHFLWLKKKLLQDFLFLLRNVLTLHAFSQTSILGIHGMFPIKFSSEPAVKRKSRYLFLQSFLKQTFHMCVSFITNMSSNSIGGISHVFHKSCPSGSRHRPHLAKVQRSRSQEQIGPRWQKVQKEPTTS